MYAIELLSFTTPWSYEGLYEDICFNPCSLYLGAFDGETLCGYLGVWHIMDEAHMTNIAVLPERRNQGIGKTLLNTAIRQLKEIGAKRLTLEVRVSNHTAQHMYKQAGFVEAGIRKKYYSDNGEDAIIMVLYMD